MIDNYQTILKLYPQLNPRQDTQIFEKFLMQLLDKLPDQKFSKSIQRVYK